MHFFFMSDNEFLGKRFVKIAYSEPILRIYAKCLVFLFKLNYFVWSISLRPPKEAFKF